MSNLNYLNLGCGNKFHKEWINVDMVSNSPYVKEHNLLKGLPFVDNQFDVIYHSHLLEHLPKEKASDFLKECLRVLKPGGIMRVVVPDLENIVKEYLKHLNANIENPSRQSEANYDWILLEMYDQTVRNHSGGQMAEFLEQPDLVNEEYVLARSGCLGKQIRNNYLTQKDDKRRFYNIIKSFHPSGTKKFITKVLRMPFNALASSKARIGAFRLGGEIHMWMYDRFSLSRLLCKTGFKNIAVKGSDESDIPLWNSYELDVQDGQVYDPTSLFMEAHKP